jgi:hypothetical protein
MRKPGVEPTTPVSERQKTVHAPDRSATVVGKFSLCLTRKATKMTGQYCCEQGSQNIPITKWILLGQPPIKENI